MCYWMPAANFQNIVKPNQIAFYVSIRIDDRIPDTCLCRQIDHKIKAMLLKQSFQKCFSFVKFLKPSATPLPPMTFGIVEITIFTSVQKPNCSRYRTLSADVTMSRP